MSSEVAIGQASELKASELRAHRNGEWQAGSVIDKRVHRQASSEVASKKSKRAQRWQARSEKALEK